MMMTSDSSPKSDTKLDSLTRSLVSNMAVNVLKVILLRFRRSFVPRRLYDENELNLIRFVFDDGVIIVNFGVLASSRIKDVFQSSTISASLNGNAEEDAIPIDPHVNSLKDVRGVFAGFPSKDVVDSIIDMLTNPRDHITRDDIDAAFEAGIIDPALAKEAANDELNTLAEIAASAIEEEEKNAEEDKIAATPSIPKRNSPLKETDFVPDVIPKKSAKRSRMDVLLLDKEKIIVELAASSLDALLCQPLPIINPTRQLVTQSPVIDTKYAGNEFRTNSKEALLLFHKFCHAALHFQQEEAENGTSLERMTARFIITYLQDPVFSMVKNSSNKLDTIPEVLKFLKEELFGEHLVQGIENMVISCAKPSANVDVEINSLKNLLSFFPETSVGKAKKLLLSLFEGWPLQSHLKEYLLHRTVEEIHVPFCLLAELATTAGRIQDMRPKRSEVNNVTALAPASTSYCTECKASFIPAHPRHMKCNNCHNTTRAKAPIKPRDPNSKCKVCAVPWRGMANTEHKPNCTYRRN